MSTRFVFSGVLAASVLIGALAQTSAPVPFAAQPQAAMTAYANVAGGLHGTAEFSGAGPHEWIAPAGVSRVLVELWGAGGGGSRPYGYQAAGDGGGSGAYVRTVIAVEGGRAYTLTVGEAGLGAKPPAPFATPGGTGGATTFATSFGQVLTFAGGGYGGHDANDGHGGLADAAAQIQRDGRSGGHGFGITSGAGGKALVGSLEAPYPLDGGSGGAGQINASGMIGSPGYAILLW